MKKIALYIILFSYTVIMIKPVSPHIADTVAHIFYYTQHMATVHYEDGNFHVHNEMLQEAKNTEKQNEVPASKKDNSTNDHIRTLEKAFTVSSKTITLYPLPSAAALIDNYLQGDFPPPRI